MEASDSEDETRAVNRLIYSAASVRVVVLYNPDSNAQALKTCNGEAVSYFSSAVV